MKAAIKLAAVPAIACMANLAFGAGQKPAATASLTVHVYLAKAVSAGGGGEVIKTDHDTTFIIPDPTYSKPFTSVQDLQSSPWKDQGPSQSCSSREGNACGAELHTETYVVR